MLDFLYVLTLIVSAPFWLMMIFRPRRPSTQRLMDSYLAFILLGALYVFTLVGALAGGIGRIQLNFTSVNSIATMLADPWVALVVWIHILAVDLAAGYWIYNETARYGMGNSALRVFLVFTLFFAPFGVFSFVLWRVLTRAARTAAEPGTSVTAPAR